jgi:hypothetical protein
MVAVSCHSDCPLEAAIRLMHPFPIFERYLAHDLTRPSPSSPGQSVTVIKGPAQVIMFTSDFIPKTGQGVGDGAAGHCHWNVFGAGERVCSGMHFALPFLKTLHQAFLPLLLAEKAQQGQEGKATIPPQVLFRPALHHRYSGRNNDGETSLSEIVYIVRLVVGIFVTELLSRVREEAQQPEEEGLKSESRRDKEQQPEGEERRPKQA